MGKFILELVWAFALIILSTLFAMYLIATEADTFSICVVFGIDFMSFVCLCKIFDDWYNNRFHC